MPKKRTRSAPDYKVGYGRPPLKTRFAPGQSGNPRGRPRGAKSVNQIAQNVIEGLVTVQENGRTRRVSRIEVGLLGLANKAMRGDLGALRLLVQICRQISEGELPKSNLERDQIAAAEARASIERKLDALAVRIREEQSRDDPEKSED